MGLIGAAAVTLIAPSLAGEGRLGTNLLEKIGVDAGAGISGFISGSPVDIISVIILAVTVLLVAKHKKSPFKVLLIMGCIGAVLGI